MSEQKTPYILDNGRINRAAYEQQAGHTWQRMQATSAANVAVQVLLEALSMEMQRTVLQVAGLIEALTENERREVLSDLLHRLDGRAVEEERRG